jgi:large-conductance mechanosensitive channel
MSTSGSTIRMETPKSPRKRKPSRTQTVVEEIHPFAGFTGFLREYAIVGLSIGFIIGNQMSALVKILVASFINPLSSLLFGSELSQRTFTLRLNHRAAQFAWGGVVFSLIDLILLLIFVYAAFKFFGLDNLAKTEDKK